MSSVSFDTSSLSSIFDSSTAEEFPEEEEEAETVVINVEPGPVEKQIEEYLNNFDLKSRIEKVKFGESETVEIKSKSLNEIMPSQDEIIFETTTERILCPEEVACYQNFPIQFSDNQQVWPSPYVYGNYWTYGNQFRSNSTGNSENLISVSNKSQSVINSSRFRRCSPHGDSASLQNNQLEKLSLTSQIIEMQQDDKMFQITEDLERIKMENEELKAKLKRQEDNILMLGPRYKYLEQNFEEFIKMKEEYLALQKQKKKAELCTETYDKYVQTWPTTIMCDLCVTTHELLQTSSLQEMDRAFCVSKTEIEDLESKFKALKKIIAERELDYENREEKAELIHLTALNVGCRARIIELETARKQGMQWVNSLQKIIAKIYTPENVELLNCQEQKWVERILNKNKKFEMMFSEEKKEDTLDIDE